MGRITEELVRRRSEHNEFMLSTLEEVALHQQSIERIELLGHLCPRLRILYLQNNLIPKIQNLHKLKELQYLNLAVNNITKVQNLQRCESLAKLDLTLNFIPKSGLLSLASLAGNHALRELFMTGNPCTDWHGYREYVVATLPQLQRLDGVPVRATERIVAAQSLPGLTAALLAELQLDGVDVVAAAGVEDDGADPLLAEEVEETGYMDEQGQMRRPWCPQTRILEHREAERVNRQAETAKAASRVDPLARPPAPARLEDFPALPEDGNVLQRNEGKWEFSLDESSDGACLVLEVWVGKYLDTSLIRADVTPRVARLLIKGRLLQLVLPAEVKPDSSWAQRSTVTGSLMLTMPKEAPHKPVLDIARLRPSRKASPAVLGSTKPARAATPQQSQQQALLPQIPKANIVMHSMCDDEVPDL